MNPSNLPKTKIVQIGLTALVDAWPTKKEYWSTLPNWALLEIGHAVIESESSWGKLIYLSREVDQMINNILDDPGLYYTRTRKVYRYMYDDGAHAQFGEISSIMTLD